MEVVLIILLVIWIIFISIFQALSRGVEAGFNISSLFSKQKQKRSIEDLEINTAVDETVVRKPPQAKYARITGGLLLGLLMLSIAGLNPDPLQVTFGDKIICDFPPEWRFILFGALSVATVVVFVYIHEKESPKF